MQYYMGQDGKAHVVDLVTDSTLVKVLEQLGIEGENGEALESDHVTSCGANGLYVLLALLGKRPNFEEVLRHLGVDNRDSRQSLAELRDAAARLGVKSASVGDAQDLIYREGVLPAIAHVTRRKRGTDYPHYLVVDDYDSASDSVRVTDVPNLPFRMTRRRFDKMWSGHALVVGRAAEEKIASGEFRRQLLWGTGSALLVLGGFVALIRISRAKSKPLLLFACCLFPPVVQVGCRDVTDKAGAVDNMVEVLGAADIDIGRFRWGPGKAAKHTFRLRNASKDLQRIREIKPSCSCLHVEAKTKNLEPGEETDITMILKSGLVSGPQEATCAVFFMEAEVPPIVLKLRAVIERNYSVLVMPLRWIVRDDEKTGDSVERTFLVREFCDWDSSDSHTDLTVRGAGLSLENVGVWRMVGERMYGFARETEVTLKYQLPTAKFFEETVYLDFRCERLRPETSDVREAEVSIVIEG